MTNGKQNSGHQPDSITDLNLLSAESMLLMAFGNPIIRCIRTLSTSSSAQRWTSVLTVLYLITISTYYRKPDRTKALLTQRINQPPPVNIHTALSNRTANDAVYKLREKVLVQFSKRIPTPHMYPRVCNSMKSNIRNQKMTMKYKARCVISKITILSYKINKSLLFLQVGQFRKSNYKYSSCCEPKLTINHRHIYNISINFHFESNEYPMAGNTQNQLQDLRVLSLNIRWFNSNGRSLKKIDRSYEQRVQWHSVYPGDQQEGQ
jgi:hypothetical protein